MAFPIEKYKFIRHKAEDGRERIIALSTYCGRPVKGTAICASDDTFDEDAGKKLAAARCEVKVAHKRAKFAQERLDFLVSTAERLRVMISKAATVAGETAAAERKAEEELEEIVKSL